MKSYIIGQSQNISASQNFLCDGRRYDIKSLDFGEVAEAVFWQYKVNRKIRGYRFTEFTLGKIAK